MANEDETFDDPNLIATPSAPDPEVRVRFVKDFIKLIDILADKLYSTSSVDGQDERRRLAVATAVSTLSAYAGQPLFIRKQGQYVPIQGLWR